MRYGLLLAVLFAGCSSSQGPISPNDGGLPPIVDGGSRDGGVRDGGALDGGAADGGARDGGAGVFYCDLPANVPGAGVPDGFCIRRFAQVKTPRTMAFAPNGDLFVGSPSSPTPGGAPVGLGGIYVLPDDDHDGVADMTGTYVSGSDYASVHGILLTGGNLYYTLAAAVYSVIYTNGDRQMPGSTPTVVADLSDRGVADRFTHTLAVDVQGQIYVSRGQFDNSTCPPPDPRAGGVLRIGPGHDAHGDAVITGCRNPLYINCAPWGCYAAELTGDGWDGIGGHEKLVHMHDGDDYGYPCCVAFNMPVPGISPAPDCSGVAVAVQSYKLHDTPFGFDWDLQNKFPAPYTGGLFLGFHGAVSSWVGTGLNWAPLDPMTHEPSLQDTPFVTGWSQSGPVVGRIAEVKFSPDGRLFFTDDQSGGIYWVAPTTMRRPGM
jgi:glucose/arabinose dehydrogenase